MRLRLARSPPSSFEQRGKARSLEMLVACQGFTDAFIAHCEEGKNQGAQGSKTGLRRPSSFLRFAANVVTVVEGVVLGQMRAGSGKALNSRKEGIIFSGGPGGFNLDVRAFRKLCPRWQNNDAILDDSGDTHGDFWL